MASSASSSAAGAEGTPPAQVSAAPPPTCGFLPARARGDRGARETGGRGEGRRRQPCPPGGCRTATARREEGTLRAVGDPAAPEGAGLKLPFRAESGTLRPPRRASILGEEVGPRDVGGLCSETFASALRKARPRAPDALAAVYRLRASVFWARRSSDSVPG